MVKGKKRVFFFILILAGVLFSVAAQEDGIYEEETEPPFDSEWDFVAPPLYSRGDKTFTISLGPVFPTVFFDSEGVLENRIKPVGGTGSLGLNYFLSSNLYVGGELGLLFISTRGKNMLFMVPMGGRVGYQFIVGRFEFPLSLLIGGVPQQYLERNHFSFFLKPEAGVFWRFNPSWSFGLNTSWWFVPQWSEHTVMGNFVALTLSARYHF
ncbi:MAG: YjbH domain-containing protein [Spirochaetaceae bacterium]|jgi:hypothetical protein|nr:YjbH domain-containing protein [Spirochaetaceae bacterium]